jgi:hypothetical protein
MNMNLKIQKQEKLPKSKKLEQHIEKDMNQEVKKILMVLK